MNKWGDTSFAIREKSSNPRLSDLVKFVKRQGAIKNDPGFINEKRPEKQTQLRTRPLTSHQKRRTDAFSTDLKTGGPNADPQKNERQSPSRCLRCSNRHELSDCEIFEADDRDCKKTQIVPCLCVKSGDMRARCVAKLFCKCGSDRRHHKLLHHPRKSNTGDAEQDPQCGKQPKKPPAEIEAQAGREVPLSVKPRTTEQYTTVTGNVLKTVLLHVVPVKLIAPNGSALTIATYGLLECFPRNCN